MLIFSSLALYKYSVGEHKMAKDKKTVNTDFAKQTYTPARNKIAGSYFAHPDNSLDYSHAYVISNENLRFTTGLTKNMARRVLTITGSGDQALFYALAGATHIDTFDVTYCAHAICDIKTGAISKLQFHEYNALLSNLYKHPHITRIENMDKVIPTLDKETANFIQDMDNYYIFGNGLSPESYPNHMLTRDEFNQLKQKIQKPFNFIWTDAMHIHEHLTIEYDVINLSNIFEWVPETTIPTLESLRKNVAVGGFIIAYTSNMLPSKNAEQFRTAQEKFKDWAKIGIARDKQSDEFAVILQRTK